MGGMIASFSCPGPYDDVRLLLVLALVAWLWFRVHGRRASNT
jgi:hypothetical protein